MVRGITEIVPDSRHRKGINEVPLVPGINRHEFFVSLLGRMVDVEIAENNEVSSVRECIRDLSQGVHFHCSSYRISLQKLSCRFPSCLQMHAEDGKGTFAGNMVN